MKSSSTMNQEEGVNGDEDCTAEGVEGKWDTTNKLCELWRPQGCVCVHISSWGAVAVFEELVQAGSTCSCSPQSKVILFKWLEHPHEHV